MCHRMAITQQQLDWWKHLAEPIPQLIEEVEKLRDRLKFIELMALTAVQSVVSEEARKNLIWEIKRATRGEFPSWYDPNDSEWK